jgi:hypothetical protein
MPTDEEWKLYLENEQIRTVVNSFVCAFVNDELIVRDLNNKMLDPSAKLIRRG